MNDYSTIGWLHHLTRMLDVKGATFVQKMYLSKELIESINDGIFKTSPETSYTWENKNPPPTDENIVVIRIDGDRLELHEIK